jgi:putative membrane protein
MKINFSTILKGSAMGIAEVIPGVSGGTIAFITGIYETLIESIKSFDKQWALLLWEKKWAEAWTKINGVFLTHLLAGMAGGILIGIWAVTWLLEFFPEPLWGFFCGLILISAWVISKQVSGWTWRDYLILVLGLVVALIIVSASPSEGSSHPFYLFVCGILAISALMLPGISGSFVLLLLGGYTLVIPALKSVLTQQDSESMIIILFFSLGCLVGLATFSRVLSWLFHSYSRPTFALLSGFLLGSLYKIWPWRNIRSVMDKNTGEVYSVSGQSDLTILDSSVIKVISESHVLPADYWMSSPKTGWTVAAFLLGLGIVWILERNHRS